MMNIEYVARNNIRGSDENGWENSVSSGILFRFEMDCFVLGGQNGIMREREQKRFNSFLSIFSEIPILPGCSRI
jgi:hypothetical protein